MDYSTPEFRLEIDGAPIPATLRASITSVSLESALKGADRVEISIINEDMRWLDHPLLQLDNSLTLYLGYATFPLTQVFVGEIVALSAFFPMNGGPTLVLTALDRRHRLQQGTKVRWFAIPIPSVGNFPLPDIATAGIVSLENQLIPIFDPVGAAISILLGGMQAVGTLNDPGSAQKFIRKEANESDYDFLARIANENGWEMRVEHGGPLGGHLLHFFSPLDHLEADVTLGYGKNLLEFTPRISTVGQIFNVTGYVWVPALKLAFSVSLGWDWDRMALSLSIYPAGVFLGQKAGYHLVKEPLTPTSAARKLIGELIPRLNKRLTGSGSTIGDPRISAGSVLRLEGLGEQFGGLYRTTKATHTLDAGGYRTRFDTRKEIWFGSIPSNEQGAIRVKAPFV